MSACAADIVVVDDDGGGAGAGGQGGAPYLDTRTLTVRVERGFGDFRFASYPLEARMVFSNAPDGSLVATATTDVHGVAQLQVVDGGAVSAITADAWRGPPFKDQILSVRVVAGSDSLRLPFVDTGVVPAAREPMAVRVEWDLVEDAVYRVSLSCFGAGVLPEGQDSLDLPDFTGCPGSDEVAIVVEVLLPDEDGYEPTFFGYVRDLGYVPGGEVTIHVPMTAGTQDATIFVAGALGGDANNVHHARLLPGTAAGNLGGSEKEVVDGGLLDTTPTAAFPELPVWSHASLEAECTNTEYEQVAPDLAPLTLALTRLAGAVPGEDGAGWQLLEGEVGDAVELTMVWSDDDGDITWRIWEPAEQGGRPAEPLELPTDLPEGIGAAPTPELTFEVRRHMDVVEARDFATFLALFHSDLVHRQEATYWFCDPPVP